MREGRAQLAPNPLGQPLPNGRLAETAVSEHDRRIVANVTDGAPNRLVHSLEAQVGVVLAPRAHAVRRVQMGPALLQRELRRVRER